MAQDGPILDSDAGFRAGAAPDRPVVAFDFDGTLTVRDSFTAFLKWRAGPRRHALGLLRLAPAALAYLLHRDRGRIKAAAVREFLRGVRRDRLEADAREFAERFSRKLLRPDAVAAWRRWRDQHVRLVIVTASPEIVVAPFARGLGADDLIGTVLAFDAQDRVAGGFSTPNCRGPEKVVRLTAAFGSDFRLKAAYGDTGGDREMLAAAEIKGYRVFKGDPMTLRFRVDKLIRDRLPAVMRAQGLTVFTRRLDDAEFVARLKDKLVEEALEAKTAAGRVELVDELADLREVTLVLAEASGIGETEIEARRLAKRAERGGFEDRIYNAAVEGDEGSEGAAYYLARPAQYPREDR